ncbi:Phox homologous domain-containing protein [Syncephalastrum racemosum]|uniref:Phox homologous domain-containing protein n=1 Tax=Syncephalastrum racemosum TaxID=13706 RepID=A0A1X2HMD5_SYNRA|nr:Phox homologous domain-containing protein [Syncephalastrum racemosum]
MGDNTVQAIYVPSTETRQQPKPHTVYGVQVKAAVQTWQVWKRYSDFVKLHDQFLSIFPQSPPPQPLPARRIFPPTFSDAGRVDERRRGLENYLRAILSSRDDRWRQTDLWKDFLGTPKGRGVNTFTSESWLDEYNGLTAITREVRSLVNKRSTHIARNEISAAHNCTVQAKKQLITLSSRLSQLDSTLSQLDDMAEGEERRRQDMLATLKEERDTLMTLVLSAKQQQEQLFQRQETEAHVSDADEKKKQDQASLLPHQKRQNSTIGTGRAFGAAAKQRAQETQVTRGLDNDGLLQYQQQTMQEQDKQVEQFSTLLARQKQLGIAIGDELEVQNQILDELDHDVGRTAMKLKFANKKLATIK